MGPVSVGDQTAWQAFWNLRRAEPVTPSIYTICPLPCPQKALTSPLARVNKSNVRFKDRFRSLHTYYIYHVYVCTDPDSTSGGDEQHNMAISEYLWGRKSCRSYSILSY